MVSEKEIEAAIKAIEAVPIMDDTYSLSGEDAKAAARAALSAAARARAEGNAGEPVAWAYELANFYTEDRGYYDFELHISKVDPRKTWEIAPDRIRNIRPLYAHPAPQPSGTVKALDLSNLLRHAFFKGVMIAGGSQEAAAEWWPEYDPETCAAYSRILSALSPAPEAQHPDDAAVDRFAAAMKRKLAQKREEGRSGWDDPEQCSAQYLSNLLRDHVEKGDPLDVGNLAMMLHQRGERISPAPEAQQEPGR